ncbi:hypothetical protein L4C34_04980 [Vibrio profundum]|uniref:hypothetical protein n=1 Tax=Vibrio profundum TaxID=2910247 RepID=UPI003D096364
MRENTLYKFQYLPILAFTLSMFVGSYLFTKTLDRWITDIVSGHMLNLIDDVANEIKQKKFDVLHMPTAQVDQFLDNLSQASTLHRFTLISEAGRVLGDSQISLKKYLNLMITVTFPRSLLH